MTTFFCFLNKKYQPRNTLSHVCFEKIPRSWEFAHAWNTLHMRQQDQSRHCPQILKLCATRSEDNFFLSVFSSRIIFKIRYSFVSFYVPFSEAEWSIWPDDIQLYYSIGNTTKQFRLNSLYYVLLNPLYFTVFKHFKCHNMFELYCWIWP